MSKLFIQAHIVENSVPFFFLLYDLKTEKHEKRATFPLLSTYCLTMEFHPMSETNKNPESCRGLLFCGYNVNFIPGVLSIAANENFLLYCTLIKVNVRGH